MSEHHSEGLQRTLKNRHLQLIAIGGAIGTGLFMGSGKTISLAGPSVLFTYMIIGFFLFFVMRAMGELLLHNLEYKSFVDFSADLLGPTVGYFVGWTYWFCWVVIGVADIVAITGYAQFWWPDIPLWLPGMMCIAFLLAFNMLSVKLFGELEFWFALIKIVAIVALIGCGIYLIATGFEGPTGDKAQISNLWNDGILPHGLSGFFAAFQIAVFAFVGIELVGTASAETADPHKTLPKAINKIPVRVIVFYVLALSVIMTVTPWSSVAADKSPFVNMFTLIGIGAAAAMINFVVLTSALSSANSGMFSTGRMLFGLSENKLAPKAFGKLSSNGVPRNGLIYSCALLLIGVALLYADGDVMHVFTIVTTISSIGFFFVWTVILLSYLKYRKVRPEAHLASNYKMPFGVPMCYATMAFFAFVLVLFWQEPDTRIGLLATPVWFIALALCYPYYKKGLKQQ
ncbi:MULTISPECIES: D-serine/D-alanine/glycine transporter [Vitreoscilla]|uniref:D-serine/D-alanine/glycine transporter n=1 Tax=Vitreoscilla stercoraria TaxID=61 RepID=A0ABY4EFP6_VITST|nr:MULTISPECIES: D-serine/D-alanine/glycine transporter [Vitreoscilla]QJQ52478.1 D-serine/D-alanine/glycine transporter [Vitreoscilla sp. C1]UOO92217.1 D-serine/D-alanine/glycine transporter [Vitreoscilla stercoraria]